jgi:peptidoglycan/xylan/chitin deacetylase (PgdA/CDA1 family)
MIAGTFSRSLLVSGVTALGLLACSEAPVDFSESGDLSSVELVGQVQQPVLQTGNIFGNNLPNKTVVLTYDDGPDEHTLELAQYLNQQGIKATFFINGKRFCQVWNGEVCMQALETRACNDGGAQAPVATPIYYRESLLDQVIALGHRIGNHTTDHCHLNGQDNPPDFEFELKTTQDIVDRHICDGLFLFRAPFGVWDAQAANLAKAVSAFDKLIGPINWDVDGGDWDCFQKGKSVEECGNGYLSLLDKRPNKNGIFLHHDRLEFNVGIDGPLKLAQYLVPRLKEQGYTFSTLDDMLDHSAQGPLGCPAPPTGGAGGMGGTSGTGGTGGAAGTAGVAGSASSAGTGGTSGSMSGGAAGTAGAGGAVSVPIMSAGTGGADYGPAGTTEQGSSCGVARGREPAAGSLLLAGLLLLAARGRRRA